MGLGFCRLLSLHLFYQLHVGLPDLVAPVLRLDVADFCYVQWLEPVAGCLLLLLNLAYGLFHTAYFNNGVWYYF